VTAFAILLLFWAAAYIGMLIWLLAKKGRLVSGGIALVALSPVPMMYGRWTTPSEWHDSPLMAAYYLPTFLALILSLILVVVGIVIRVRQALLARGGAQ